MAEPTEVDTAALRLFYAELADADPAVIRDITALCDALDAANDLGQSMTVGLGRAAEERDQALTEAADLRRQLHAANERYEAALEQRDAHFEAREAFRVDLEAAEARLAAVLALCDYTPPGSWAAKVRAAATQPAAEPTAEVTP